MILIIQVRQMFLKCFQNNTIKIILILAPGPGFFCATCIQFPLTFTE